MRFYRRVGYGLFSSKTHADAIAIHETTSDYHGVSPTTY